jgi:hypothetical protein
MRIVLMPTFDYEVYHGRNFSDDAQVLFRPTERLMRRANEVGIPFTLFADVCSMAAYRANGLNGSVESFENQLRASVTLGHDVQLHVHPHWLSASLDGSEWHLLEPKMTLADLNYDSGVPRDVISSGVAYLEGLLRELRPEYRCVAFRAGGLALEPRRRDLFNILAESGILIDSSVAKGYVVRNDVLSVDYRNAPEAANWRIDGIFEIPIATFNTSVPARLRFLLRRIGAVRGAMRGRPISRSKRQTRARNILTMLLQNLNYLNPAGAFLFSADTKGYTRQMLVSGFKQYVRRHYERSDVAIYVSMINHPKLLFESQEKLLFDVLEELRDYYNGSLTFATYLQVSRSLEEEGERLHQ